MNRTAALEDLYEGLPRLVCRGRCAESCGPIGLTRLEAQRIREVAGEEPQVDASLTCTMLREDRCLVYLVRPLLCRLWGLVESMPCPWGCRPDPGYLTVQEGHRLLEQAEQIGGPARMNATFEQMLGYMRTAKDS